MFLKEYTGEGMVYVSKEIIFVERKYTMYKIHCY